MSWLLFRRETIYNLVVSDLFIFYLGIRHINFHGIGYLEDNGSIFFRNIVNYLPDCAFLGRFASRTSSSFRVYKDCGSFTRLFGSYNGRCELTYEK